MSAQREQQQLDAIASNSIYGLGCNAKMIQYSFDIARRHMRSGTLLEMGTAEGVMTELLVSEWPDLHLLEGSGRFCEQLRERFPTAHVHHKMFEDFEPPIAFDNIILGHVLEHVDDPVGILNRVKSWLTPRQGRVFAAVPNARSLHRQAAVLMGLLPQEDSMSELDHRHGHRRVFNPESFRAVFHQAGLRVDVFGGYWLKPVSNAQIDADWTPAMLDAFMQMGERYPDIAAEIYVLASVPSTT